MSINLNYTVTGKRELSAPEKQYLQLLANLYPDGALREIYLLDNHEAYPDGNGVKGAVYVFHPDAKVRGTAPFSVRMLGHIVAARLEFPPGQAVDENVMRKKLFVDLPKLVPVISTVPFRLGQQNPNNATDSTEWLASLGDHSSNIHFSKEVVQGMSPVYHLVINSQVDQMGRELLDMIVQRDATMTFQQLLDSPEYARMRIASHRNACRILATAAELLEAKIVFINDEYAHVDDGHFDAPPRLAVPDVHTPYNYIECRHVNGKKAIVYYSHTTGLQDNRHAVIQMINPSVGVRMYLADPEADQNSGGPFSNDAVSAFPIGVGRLLDPTALRQRKRNMETQPNARSFADLTFGWYDKEAKSLPTANDRTYAYSDLSKEVASNLAENLGARYGYIELQPVAVLLPKVRAAT